MKIPSRRLHCENLENRILLTASAQLVKDLNTTPVDNQEHAWLGDEIFFAADDGTGDVELWKSDGTSEGTMRVADIRTGSSGSFPKSLVATEDRVFFTAADDSHGRELWITDGTEGGTVRVTDLRSGSDHSFDGQEQFVPAGGQVFFSFEGEPWRTDGTAEGTRLVKDIGLGDAGSYPQFAGSIGGKVYFSATSDGDEFNRNRFDLWESDGTETGTQMVASGAGGVIASTNDAIYFFEEPYKPSILRKYSPSTGQTSIVKDADAFGDFIRGFETVADQLYFFTSSGSTWTLWRTENEAGVVQLAVFGNRNPVSNLTAVQDTLYFEVGGQPSQLWSTDGTSSGTQAVPGVGSIDPGSIWRVDDQLYYTSEATIGNDLGRIERDQIDRLELPLDDDRSPPAVLASKDGVAFFWTDEQGLWKTDGTQTGTVRLGDISGATEGTAFVTGPGADSVAAVDGGVVFLDRETGLSFSDGESISRLELGLEISGFRQLVSYRGNVYFSASNADQGLDNTLWYTDGTVEGTHALTISDGTHIKLVGDANQAGDMLFFTGCAGDECGLWLSDGSPSGTVRVHNARPDSVVGFNGHFYFMVNSALWMSDGTAVGTRELAQLSANHRFSEIIAADHQLFVAQSGDFRDPDIIWVSDGTTETAPIVFDIPSELIAGSRLTRPFLVIGNSLLLNSTNGIWITDGTTDGTRQISSDAIFGYLVGAAGENAYFADYEALWVTDGTEIGTRQVAGGLLQPYFSPNTLDAFFTAEAINGQLYLASRSASYDTVGYELWRTDGTDEGTVQLTQLGNGDLTSIPKYITESNGSVYFTADDGFHGRELYRLPLDVEPDPIPGDSNHDGIFNSSDLVQVFQAAKYENDIANDATWEDGDWNGDGDFDSSDLVFAFQQGNYVRTAVRDDWQGKAVASLFADEDRFQKRQRGGFEIDKHSLIDETFARDSLLNK